MSDATSGFRFFSFFHLLIRQNRGKIRHYGRRDLSKEIRLLIVRYVSEQNSHSTCAIDPGLGCSPTC